jgi:hypothetical protein
MATRVIQTKYYEFDQNNSGGRFDVDDERGIGPSVWIEAVDVAQASSRAEDIGIYFEGVREGRDCECCGDRWSRPWRDDGKDKPEPNFGWTKTAYIHQLDGEIIRVLKQPQ